MVLSYRCGRVPGVESDTGLAYWVKSAHDVCWLAVEHGRVVRGTPWLARRLLGAGSNRVEAEAATAGAVIWWTPLSAPPEPFQTHLAQTWAYRRWWHEGERQLAGYHLTFGEAPPGWFVKDGRLECALRVPAAADAWAVTSGLVGRGGWQRTWANAGSDDPPLPDGLDETV
jgi:hypothetical protein